MRRAIAFLIVSAMLAKLSQSSPHRGRMSTIGGPVPVRERKLLQRVHHRRGGAHVDVREAQRHRVGDRPQVGAADVDRDDEVRVERRDADRQVVDHAAVDAQPAAHAARREKAREARTTRTPRPARGTSCEPGRAPVHRHAALDVHRIDEQRHRQRRRTCPRAPRRGTARAAAPRDRSRATASAPSAFRND